MSFFCCINAKRSIIIIPMLNQVNPNANKINTNKKINFPIKYDLKVIILSISSEEENKITLKKIFSDLKIPFKYISTNKSKTAKYLSFTYNITVPSQSIFDKLYSSLNKIKGIKAAI